MTTDNDPNQKLNNFLFDWSHKQGRILTANGNALKYYAKERGFPFKENELPHYHLMLGDTFHTFRSWCQQLQLQQGKYQESKRLTGQQLSIVGVWKRTLFLGEWEYTTDKDEDTFNIQTKSLFIDIRIPKVAKSILQQQIPRRKQYVFNKGNTNMNFDYRFYYIVDSPDINNSTIFHSWTTRQLQLYARRHAFAGYTLQELHPPNNNNNNTLSNHPRMICTRFHCIDWNFIGIPRSRPNKWYVQIHTTDHHHKIWRELSFATNEDGQHYYMEQWERYDGDGDGQDVVIALRRKWIQDHPVMSRDAILLILGDHFAMIQGRRGMLPYPLQQYNNNNNNLYSKATLVDLIDVALENGNRDIVKYFLSMDAAHGRISQGWMIDCCIQYWKEGMHLLDPTQIKVKGTSMDTCQVFIHDTEWDVYESSIHDIPSLKSFFENTIDIHTTKNSKL